MQKYLMLPLWCAAPKPKCDRSEAEEHLEKEEERNGMKISRFMRLM